MIDDRHIDEEQLQRFSTDAASMEKKLRGNIERHLQRCAFCREQYRTLKAETAALERDRNEDISLEAVDLMNRIRSEELVRRIDTIELRPTARLQPSNHEKPRRVALAAQNARASVQFAHVTTLVSDDEQTFVRVQQEIVDDTRCNLHLHVMSDDPIRYANVVLRLANIPGEYRTDANGEATIFDAPASIDIFQLRAFIDTRE